MKFKDIGSFSANQFQLPILQRHTFQIVNKSNQTPLGQGIMIARKKLSFIIGIPAKAKL